MPGAVIPPSKTGCGGIANSPSPPKPVSFSFSTPTTRTMSYTLAATAKAAFRKASVPVAHPFSTWVTGLYWSFNGIDMAAPVIPVDVMPAPVP